MVDIASVKGVGEHTAKKFTQLGVASVEDAITFYPRRYDDYSVMTPIAKLQQGPVTIEAQIVQISGRYVRRGMHITEALAKDATGSARLVWFNQPYREAGIKKDMTYFISGEFQLSRSRLAIMNPAMEKASDFPVNAARIVPIYRETKGLKSTTIRKVFAQLRPSFGRLHDHLPESVMKQNGLMSYSQAILGMHFPASNEQLEQARRRLGFEEVFRLSLASLINKAEAQKEQTHQIPFNEELAREFVGKLPFELTDDQRKVAWQIFKDLERPHPMNRLVEGDVGSGKTVVAVMASMMAIDANYQVAIMAPTELLARQHAENVRSMMQLIGRADEVGLLIGALKPAQKREVHRAIADKHITIIVGTHALFSDAVAMQNLGLVIVDEQHRFGVEQRKKLQQKATGRMPHVLSMTATPIPRTLALTLYGELDISVIKHKPSNRLPIITKVISPNSKKSVYGKIEEQLQLGRQAFVVCPLITDSDNLDALSAESVFKDFSTKVFKHNTVGLLHGKLKPEEKDAIMTEFSQGAIDILVSTTVIEVGVDVPNATIMMIEGADRFGLAQIHQLRGRVGRSEHQGYCYLVTSDSSAPSKRLRAIESSSDGFRLSELDLEIRGPGAIYGQSQSGELDLRVAKLSDVELIESARTAAQQFLDSGESLDNYPVLQKTILRYRSITNLN
jgi:ATP-dependent DNA helicase RecG